MTTSLKILRHVSITLLVVFLSPACMQFTVDTPPALPTVQDIAPPMVEEEPTLFLMPTETLEPVVPVLFTATALPNVTLNVVNGNLFVRRGPDMAFNPVGVLYKNTSTKAIARDVLSDWVQVTIPNSNETGWVSIQTDYSQLEGSLKDLPEFTTTEWPQAAYLRNCTYHRMYVMPGEMVVYPSFQYPDNEIWIYPGEYTVYDIDVPGDPEVVYISIREGSDVEILEDGLGGHRKCP